MIEIALRRIFSKVVANPRVATGGQGKTDRGWQDKAGFPASATSFLSVCLHIALGRSFDVPPRSASGAFSDYHSFSMPREPSPAIGCKSEMAISSPAQVFPAASRGPHFRSCATGFDFQSSSDGRATKTTFVFVPARSAIVVAGKYRRVGSAWRVDARPASSVRSIGRSGAPAAIRTRTPAPGREAAGSMRGVGAPQRR
jgi:hypothetical protein